MRTKTIPAFLLPCILGTLGMSPARAYSPVFDPIWNYAADEGAVFGTHDNGYAYGWSADNRANAYERNNALALDERYDRGVVMDDKNWEVALENGTYWALVVAGDPGTVDADYKILAEGTLVVDGKPRADWPYVSGRVQVKVADGKLTLSSAPGARNNRLAYVHLQSPLFGTYDQATYAPSTLKIDVGHLGQADAPALLPGWRQDKLWIENSDYGFYAPGDSLTKISTQSTTKAVTGTTEPAVYQTNLSGSFAYRVRLKNGKYQVVAKFTQFTDDRGGRFNLTLSANGSPVKTVDIFKTSGQGKACDVVFDVDVKNELLEIGITNSSQWNQPILHGLIVTNDPQAVPVREAATSRQAMMEVRDGLAHLSPAQTGDVITITNLQGRTEWVVRLAPGQTFASLPKMGRGLRLIRLLNAEGAEMARKNFLSRL